MAVPTERSETNKWSNILARHKNVLVMMGAPQEVGPSFKAWRLAAFYICYSPGARRQLAWTNEKLAILCFAPISMDQALQPSTTITNRRGARQHDEWGKGWNAPKVCLVDSNWGKVSWKTLSSSTTEKRVSSVSSVISLGLGGRAFCQGSI